VIVDSDSRNVDVERCKLRIIIRMMVMCNGIVIKEHDERKED
jgi:hypothetical protein